MIVRVLANARGVPEHKLADVELVFDDGPLFGLKLVGTAIWATREAGDVSITFPARTYQAEDGTRYYNFLRPEGDRSALDRLKTLIKEEYRRSLGIAA